MNQRSKSERLWWSQFDALEMGSGWDEHDIQKPQIMIEDAYGDSPSTAFSKKAVSRHSITARTSATAARREDRE